MKNDVKNEMRITFDAISSNESLARVAVAAFASQMDPTIEELADVKTAVSEAVTNAIIHGYGNVAGYGKRGATWHEEDERKPGKVDVRCKLENGVLTVTVEDQGKGIEDVEKAMEPLYTTRPDLDRSGRGFAFMEAFMDDLQVESAVGVGTIVRMQKKMTSGPWIRVEG